MPLHIIRNDLTRMTCDAVVNPTDERLSGSGGLDAQLRRAAGKRLDAACARIGSCAPGEAVLTRGYDLPARYVIHTVGPRWTDGTQGERETLASCYRAALGIVRRRRLRSVAFPIIAAGTFGFPKAEALDIAVREIRAFLAESEADVFLVVFNRECYEISMERRLAIQTFLDQNYVEQHEAKVLYSRREPRSGSRPPKLTGLPAPAPGARREEDRAPQASAAPSFALPGPDRVLDESFSEMLLRKIDERGMTDAECYKKANVDRKLFSKIRNNVHYQPKKTTAVAFAIALELDLKETRELLMKAGFALSHSQRFDVVIEYFILERNYDVFDINKVLFKYDQPLLGA